MDEPAGYQALQEGAEVSHHIQEASDVVDDILLLHVGVSLTDDGYQQVQKH